MQKDNSKYHENHAFFENIFENPEIAAVYSYRTTEQYAEVFYLNIIDPGENALLFHYGLRDEVNFIV